jgi:cellulose synthase/poly-beta-1,6-N-acetylglucosamine synthase-like glycosyltransferase
VIGIIIIAAVFSSVYLASTVFLFTGLKRIHRCNADSRCYECSFSVVIAARNEEANIKACIDSVCSQTIASQRYEVIVVNDRSTDRTAEYVMRLSDKYPNVRLINIFETSEGMSPKKYAVARGIEEAQNEIIVFTDADCLVNTAWLETINSYFDDNTGLVQGRTAYLKPYGMNSIFFNMQSLDFLSHGIVSAAGIGAGFPINSNANNMAFRKKAFYETGGYGSSAGVVSGDDDLLLQRIWKSRKWTLKYMPDKSGAVSTKPADSFHDMFEQRKRWGSKTVHYTLPQVIFLGGIFVFYLCVVSMIAASFFIHKLWPPTMTMVLIKMLGEAIIMLPGLRLFGRNELCPYIIPASFLQLPLVISAVIMGVFFRFGWKGGIYRRKISSQVK